VGARATFAEARQVYGLFGAEDKIAMEEVKAGMIQVEIPPDDASAEYAAQLEPNLHG